MNGSEEARGPAFVADIGGTNARFALADLETLQLSDVVSVGCADHPSLTDAALAYVEALAEVPRFGAVGVAAPVTGEAVAFTNSPWSFTRGELCGQLDLDGLLILNDFEALAHALPFLAPADLHQLGGSEPVERAAKIVLGPGTGLGAAGLVWSPAGWIALPGEGGHINLAPAHIGQLPLLERLMASREHYSVERILSGPGFCELYAAVAGMRGKPVEDLTPEVIAARAASGEDPLAVETLETFVVWLGSFAGDAALMLGARGGVYLGGGIPMRILDFLRDGRFREAFESKGRMRSLLEPIPIYVIAHPAPALTGAAAALKIALRQGDAGFRCPS